MTEDRYIWIVRWESFQHYTPRRDRGPAWIKDYTAQMHDERYLRLSDRQRALIRDLRDVFATMRGRLPDDTAMIARQRNSQTRRVDLDALNHAGFIEFCSRQTLEQRLEELYASRAPAPSLDQTRPEEPTGTTPRSEPKDLPAQPAETQPPTPSTNGTLDVQQELLLTKLLAWIGDDADDRTAAVVRHALSQSTEAARVELEAALPTARARHRAKYVVGTLKHVTGRGKTPPPKTYPDEPDID